MNSYDGALTFQLDSKDGAVKLARHAPGSHVASLCVYVAEHNRRRGFGRELIEMALETAPSLGIHRVEATPYADNGAAVLFFNSLDGFEYEGIRKMGGKRGDKFVDTYLFAWTSP